jgi:hypothetical protein
LLPTLPHISNVWYAKAQERTNSPTIWLIISFILFGVHSEECNGAAFKDPYSKIIVQITMVSFVESTICQVNDFNNNNVTPEELIDKIQKDDQLGFDLIWILGGLLQ